MASILFSLRRSPSGQFKWPLIGLLLAYWKKKKKNSSHWKYGLEMSSLTSRRILFLERSVFQARFVLFAIFAARSWSVSTGMMFGYSSTVKPIAPWLIKLCTIFGSQCVLGLRNRIGGRVRLKVSALYLNSMILKFTISWLAHTARWPSQQQESTTCLPLLCPAFYVWGLSRDS